MDPPAKKHRTAFRITDSPWVERACLGVASAVLVAFRLHAFDLPLENDECNYAYIGARLLAGDGLYVDVWDHQPPGVFVLFAGVIALFGDAPYVLRWMTTLFSLVSMGLVFAILRRVSSRGAAICGAMLFAMVSSDPGTAGEGCNREIYMTTLILAAWYFALRSVSHGFSRGEHDSAGNPRTPPLRRWGTGPHWAVFVAGCALALASSLKTIVAVHWLFLAIWIAYQSRDRGRHAYARVSVPRLSGEDMATQAWTMPPDVSQDGTDSIATQAWAMPLAGRVRAAATPLLLFAAGPLLLWLGVSAYFSATGRLDEFVDATFLFNLSYSGSSEGFLVRFGRFFAPPRHPFIFDSALPLWIGAIGATVWLSFEGFVRRRPGAPAVALLVLASYVAACLPARFWPHYYYLLIAPAVIAVSMAVGLLVTWIAGAAADGSRDWRHWLLTAGVSLLLFAVFPAAVLATEYDHYLRQPLFGITVQRYNSRDFWGRAQGENVRSVTDTGDEIFVFGNDAEIYYYSGRRCASRFTMITGLQSGYAGAEKRRKVLMAELEERPPRLIVVLFDEQPFEEWKTFLSEHYGEPIGWDYHDRTGQPIMFVLTRRDRPVEKKVNWDWDRSEVGGWFLGEKRPSPPSGRSGVAEPADRTPLAALRPTRQGGTGGPRRDSPSAGIIGCIARPGCGKSIYRTRQGSRARMTRGRVVGGTGRTIGG
jgi:hypothetical protein